jgi:L-fucose isomerase-like protein
MDSSKTFGFITVASSITPVPPDEIAGDLQMELLNSGGAKLTPEEIGKDIPLLLLVLTGGTEQKILELHSERKKTFPNEPLLLLAHPSNNSLPSALEVLARIQQDGNSGKIIYMDENSNKECRHDLSRLVKYYQIYHKIVNAKIGLIGEPSDWLVASSPSADTIYKSWGSIVEHININEFIESIDKIKNDEIEIDHHNLITRTAGIKEPSKKELVHAVKVYTALKKVVSKYKLSALSLRCFDLVTELKTTGCFALSKLNDDGIVAGCEGDLVSTLGMIWVNNFTDQPVWMANPARLVEHNNSVWLAHCTVPLGLVDKYKLRSHFESGLGVGIEGGFSKGKITLVRLGGKNLDRIWITNGEILETGSDENLCRTQVHVKLHGAAKVTDLLDAPLGNHLLMVRGNYAKELFEWWEMFIHKALKH